MNNQKTGLYLLIVSMIYLFVVIVNIFVKFISLEFLQLIYVLILALPVIIAPIGAKFLGMTNWWKTK